MPKKPVKKVNGMKMVEITVRTRMVSVVRELINE